MLDGIPGELFFEENVGDGPAVLDDSDRSDRCGMQQQIFHGILPVTNFPTYNGAFSRGRVSYRRASSKVLVGIDHHVVLLPELVQCTDHLHRVLEMDVVVRRTMNDQQTRAVVAEQVREIDGRIVVVSLRMVFGKTVEFSV